MSAAPGSPLTLSLVPGSRFFYLVDARSLCVRNGVLAVLFKKKVRAFSFCCCLSALVQRLFSVVGVVFVFSSTMRFIYGWHFALSVDDVQTHSHMR